MSEQTILRGVTDVLRQGETLLRALDESAYTARMPGAFNASVGGHFRHCLDHFQSLLDSLDADEVRHDYDHHRPHEALGQKPPVRAYAPSKRRWPQHLPVLRYPQSFAPRRVLPHGDIKWQGRLRFIGRIFVGETLGLKTLSPHHCAVHLGALLIGELHSKDAAGMRPARWQRLPDKLVKV